MHTNILIIESTGYRPTRWDPEFGIMVEVDEFEIIYCDVSPKLGVLVCDTVLPAAQIMAASGVEGMLPSTQTHIGDMELITEFEVALMISRGVDVTTINLQTVC